MKIFNAILLQVIFCNIFTITYCSQAQKSEVLNAVTNIKPIQQIILGYLDVPDHLVHTFVIDSSYSHATISHKKVIISPGIIWKKYDIETGDCSASHADLARMGKVLDVCSPDGKYGVDTNTLEVYCLDTRKLLFNINFIEKAQVIKFSPNSQLLAAVTNQKLIIIWDLHNQSISRWSFVNKNRKTYTTTFTTAHQPRFTFSADNKYILCANTEGLINIFDLTSNQKSEFQLACKKNDKLCSIQFTSSGTFLLCNYTSCVSLHDAKTGEKKAELPHKHDFMQWAYAPDYTYIAGIKPYRNSIEIYDTYLQKVLGVIPLNNTVSTSGQVHIIHDGTYLVYVDIDPHKKIIKVFKNQAHDLHCPLARETNLITNPQCIIS